MKSQICESVFKIVILRNVLANLHSAKRSNHSCIFPMTRESLLARSTRLEKDRLRKSNKKAAESNAERAVRLEKERVYTA
jgi:hypothetical protein